MANDVTIVVEASLGDTLLKLELAKHAVEDLGDAGSVVGRDLGDESNRNSFASRMGNLERRLSNLGDRGPLGMIVRAFGNLGAAMVAPVKLGAEFAENFERAGSVAQVAIGSVAALGIGIAGLSAALAGLAAIAVVAADALGTLVAIAADLVAPVTLLGGLLGGLGVGFFIAAKRAAEGGIHLKGFSDRLAVLQSMFHRTSTILAQQFLPYLIELAEAGEKALLFFDKIIKLPLKQAFHAIDTQGVAMLGKFVDRVAEVLRKPIKLAFHVAFQDTAFANMVADWWHRFTGFLFGEMQRKPIRLADGRIIGFSERQVDGIFQPFLNWFNRHNFTRQGIQIGNAVAKGIGRALGEAHIQDFLASIFKDAARKTFEFWVFSMRAIVTKSIPLFMSLRSAMVRIIGQAATSAAARIRSALGAAWDWVLGKVKSIWSAIVAFIEAPLHINITWPSPPSWLSHLPGSGIIGDIAGGVGGVIGHAVPSVAAPRAMGSVVVHQTVHIHGADLSDAPTRRRIAQKLGKEIAADWRRRADGH